MSSLKPVVRFLLRTISPIYHPGAQVKVALFHHARTGSTVVNSMLRQHSNIHWAGEILRKGVVDRVAPSSFDLNKYLAHSEFATRRKVYGLEIKFADIQLQKLTPMEMLALLQRRGYQHIILLRRLNILRQLLSLEVMKVAGFSHLPSITSTQLRQVHLPCSNLVERIEWNQKSTSDFKDLLTEIPHLELIYEKDIQQDPSVAYRSICNFIHIEPKDIAPKLTRINPYSLREILLNYDEVVSALQHTPHAWMLDDEDSFHKDR